MPYEDPDPEDPMALVGVALPCGIEAPRDMTYVVAEEFARMGYDEERILALFREPFYAGAHRAYEELGEDEVRSIVAEVASVWGRVRLVDRDAAPGGPGGLLQISTAPGGAGGIGVTRHAEPFRTDAAGQSALPPAEVEGHD